nr:discoidin domain-containing protein [Odoribacter sp.]
LLDNDPNTFWQPEQQPSLRQYDLEIDMKSLQTVHGLKIVQKNFNPSTDYSSSFFLPESVQVLVSTDRITWEMPMYVEDNVLGNTNGEITLLQFPVEKNIRYIRLSLSDRANYSNFGITLADIVAF